MGNRASSKILDSLKLPWFILEDDPLCSQTDPELFFPEEKLYSKTAYYSDLRAAKDICSKCPLIVECFKYAITNHPVQGVWGGTTEAERREVRRGRGAKLVRDLGIFPIKPS